MLDIDTVVALDRRPPIGLEMRLGMNIAILTSHGFLWRVPSLMRFTIHGSLLRSYITCLGNLTNQRGHRLTDLDSTFSSIVSRKSPWISCCESTIQSGSGKLYDRDCLVGPEKGCKGGHRHALADHRFSQYFIHMFAENYVNQRVLPPFCLLYFS